MIKIRLLIAGLVALAALALAPAALASAPTVSSLSGTEGTALPASTVVATFTDVPGLFGCNAGSAYTATINWGDGSAASSGTVVNTGGGGLFSNCDYSVSAGHTYAEFGTYTVTVGLTSPAGTTQGQGTATIADAALTAGTAVAVTATEGKQFNGTVANFSDANTLSAVGDFGATIIWGDGTTSQGTVFEVSAGQYGVYGTHTWAEEGSYRSSVTVTDAGGSNVTINGSATVADAALTAGTSTTISPTATLAFSGALGTFTDADSAAPAGDFTATVTWGDGSTSAATVTATGTAGTFSVSGGHTYATAGNYSIGVAIHDTGGSTTTLAATANVAAPPLSAGAAATITGIEAAQFSGAVANFSDANLSDVPGDINATIAWGDGATSQGTVSQPSAGQFSVSGTHTWADDGSYAVVVTIAAADGASLTINGTATVGDAALAAGAPATITPTSGTAFSGAVGTFTDANTGAPASDFTGTITWGDGSTSAATITTTSTAGKFSVSGSHTYSSSGSFAFSVAIKDAGGSTIGLAGTANVATPTPAPPPTPPALTTVKTYNPTATAGQSINTLLGAFSDADSGTTTSSYSATITWGDGATSDGTITAGTPGTFGVSGTHAYAAAGSYTITIVVKAPLNRTLTITTSATISPAPSSGPTGPTGTTGTTGPPNTNPKPTPKPKPKPKTLAVVITHAAVIGGPSLAATVLCPSSATTCRGYVSVKAGNHKVTTMPFILPGGKSGTFDLHIPAPGLLRRLHLKLKVKVTAKDPSSGLTGQAAQTVAP